MSDTDPRTGRISSALSRSGQKLTSEDGQAPRRVAMPMNGPVRRGTLPELPEPPAGVGSLRRPDTNAAKDAKAPNPVASDHPVADDLAETALVEPPPEIDTSAAPVRGADAGLGTGYSRASSTRSRTARAAPVRRRRPLAVLLLLVAVIGAAFWGLQSQWPLETTENAVPEDTPVAVVAAPPDPAPPLPDASADPAPQLLEQPSDLGLVPPENAAIAQLPEQFEPVEPTAVARSGADVLPTVAAVPENPPDATAGFTADLQAEPPLRLQAVVPSGDAVTVAGGTTIGPAERIIPVPRRRAVFDTVVGSLEEPQVEPSGVFDQPHRVIINFNPNSAASERIAEELSAALVEDGATNVETAGVALFVSSTHVRAFHEQDNAVGLRVAEMAGDDIPVRDFTDYAPRPQPGLIEVWLSDN